LEKWLNKEKLTDRQKLIRGAVMVFIVVISVLFVSWALLFVAYHIHFLVGLFVESFMCYQILAVKGLKKESMKVYAALKENDLEKARNAVAMIVGRDTKSLDEHGVTRAAVETVAENTSDGVIAPLLFMLIFGAVGGFVYKAINTMDSMVGYKNDRYMYFGRFAAKTDDAANFIPSRIAAFLMIGATWLLEHFSSKEERKYYDAKNSFKIYKRDRYKHSSPNSAQTESVCAGALSVALSGNNYYFGKLVKKPVIGDSKRPLEAEDIKRSNRLLYVTSFLMIAVVILGRVLCI
jgi:adenosylcobinamide-phosphate synthase